MSEFKSSNFTNEDNSGGPDLVGITTFTSPYYFVPPSGTTAQRPSGDGIAPGMLRFNTDIGRLEVWRGDHWATILGESPSLNGGARGLFGGGIGTPATASNIIEYITIASIGNSIDFGDLTLARNPSGQSSSSSTRGLFFGGSYPADSNVIDYVTISSTGNALDFGDTIVSNNEIGTSFSSSTRAVRAGGRGGSGTNVMDYVTIASLSNSIDYGDLTVARRRISSCSSSTRGIIFGGEVQSPSIFYNIIDYVTILTTGNAIDFGDILNTRNTTASCSSSIRGIVGGGTGPAVVNTIEFITISTLGNAQDFGDLTQARFGLSACSSPTRGIFAGGYYVVPATTLANTIDYVTITSTGNAQDFGDLINGVRLGAACSNAHGGL